MIKLDLGEPFKALLDERNKFLNNSEHRSPNYFWDEIKGHLNRKSHNKCAYCEINLMDWGKIEHYRPINGARDLDGRIHSDYYWWLRYEWNNLLPLCKNCISHKSNRFPVISERVQRETYDNNVLDNEKPFLIHPGKEDPEEFLLYDSKGYVFSNDKRAQVTIDILGLNRSQLVEDRRNAFEVLENVWLNLVQFYNSTIKYDSSLKSRLIVNEAIENIKRQIKATSEFSGLKKYFIRLWLLKNSSIRRYLISKEPAIDGLLHSSPKIIHENNLNFNSFKHHETMLDNYDIKNSEDRTIYFGKRRYIERIVIRNFKSIKELDIEVSLGKSMEFTAPWLMLLGDNGTGKSTVLNAIALTLMDEESRKKYINNASSLLYPGAKEGYVLIHLSGSYDPIIIRFNKDNKDFILENNEFQRVILLGYGSTRLLPKSTSRKKEQFGLLRVDNLFNPLHFLTNASRQLYNLKQKDFEYFVPVLQSLLMLENTPIIKDRNAKNKITVQYNDKKTIYIDDLSDGYRSMIALAVDIMMSLWNLNWTHRDGEAIVLIDELDAHLHPKWILQVVTRLRNTFPNLQFIVTSHDPLCLRGLDQNEVAVLRRDIENEVFLERDLPPQSIMEVDTLLKSQFFGLNYTLDPQTNEDFNNYYKLLTKSNLTEEQEKQLRILREKFISNKHLGNNPREQLMYEVIDEYMANLQYKPLNKLKNLKDETKKKVKEILTSIEGIDF
ncbi:AAA family ATPase [Gottfriedia sp. NPDC058432]|uniref:AAA family ATPase n=1 Tax=Gottfriedia sp. NPDC058432 TaxID=3346497 RepID=UPI003663252B